MSKCEKCGLFSSQNNKCQWFSKKLTEKEMAAGDECTYFTDIIYEDDEPLTPYQHLMFKRQDVASKKMQGPV